VWAARWGAAHPVGWPLRDVLAIDCSLGFA
jgi:hypothetical protein